MPTVHAQTLRRAAEIVGGIPELGTQFGVPAEDLALWINGAKPVPQEIFLRAVDIVTANDVNEISNGDHPSVKITAPTFPDPNASKPS